VENSSGGDVRIQEVCTERLDAGPVDFAALRVVASSSRFVSRLEMLSTSAFASSSSFASTNPPVLRARWDGQGEHTESGPARTSGVMRLHYWPRGWGEGRPRPRRKHIHRHHPVSLSVPTGLRTRIRCPIRSLLSLFPWPSLANK
jgi:hypothetical protein